MMDSNHQPLSGGDHPAVFLIVLSPPLMVKAHENAMYSFRGRASGGGGASGYCAPGHGVLVRVVFCILESQNQLLSRPGRPQKVLVRALAPGPRAPAPLPPCVTHNLCLSAPSRNLRFGPGVGEVNAHYWYHGTIYLSKIIGPGVHIRLPAASLRESIKRGDEQGHTV